MPKGGSKPGERRGGRQKGTPNVISKSIKAMMEEALTLAGGVDYLYQQSVSNPTAFLTLVGKLMPKDINLAATINVHDAIVELAKRKGE